MKQATIHIKLQKEMSVVRHEVTPLEAMLLVAEHQRNVGGSPIEVDEKGEPTKDAVRDVVEITVEGVDAAGKPVKRTRTDDEELNRLRTRYNAAKIDTICTKVRTFPTTFKEAIEKGLGLTLPSAKLSETRLV